MSGNELYRQLELGSGYQFVTAIEANHLYAYRRHDPARVVVASPTKDLVDVVGVSRFRWGASGHVLFYACRSVVCRFHIRDGGHTNFFEARSEGPRFSVSPSEEEMVLLERSVDENQSRYILSLVALPDRRASIALPENGTVLSFGVCWLLKQAIVRYQGGDVDLFDLTTLGRIEHVNGDLHWRGKKYCHDLECELHWPPWIRAEQELFEFADAAYVLRAESLVALLLNSTELRVTTLDSPDDSELVVRFRGPQFGSRHGRNGSSSTAVWSPDGRLIAGTLEKVEARELGPYDVSRAEYLLERNGIKRGSMSELEWEQLVEDWCRPMRFSVWRYRYIVDLARREIAIEPGELYPYFAPVPSAGP